MSNGFYVLFYNPYMPVVFCSAAPTRPAERCKSKLDVAFIVDSSAASVAKDYGKEKEFVKAIASTLDIDEGGSHAGIVLFNGDSEVAMKFSESNNASEFSRAVDKLRLLGGKRRRMDKALKLAFDKLFTPEYGMRMDAAQVLVLLTDGGQTQEAGAVALSQAIVPFHEANVKVLVVGIGPDIKKDELRSIVKSDEDLYIAGDFGKLKSDDFSKSVSKAVCIEGKFSTQLDLIRLGPA